MSQYWNDTSLSWQTWDGTNEPWKDPAMPWNDNTHPWKAGAASVIGGGEGEGVPMGLLLALTYAE